MMGYPSVDSGFFSATLTTCTFSDDASFTQILSVSAWWLRCLRKVLIKILAPRRARSRRIFA